MSVDLRIINNDINSVVNAKSVIRQYGSSTAIVALLNANNCLTQFDTTIPSCESLTGVNTPNTDALINTLSNAHRHLNEAGLESLRQWVEKHSKKLIASAVFVTGILTGGGVLAMIAAGTITMAALAIAKDKLFKSAMIRYSELKSAIATLDDLLAAHKAFASLSVPETEDEFKQFVSSVKSICAKISSLKYYGDWSFNEEKEDVVAKFSWSGNWRFSGVKYHDDASASDLGYSQESLKATYDAFVKVNDDFKKQAESAEGLVTKWYDTYQKAIDNPDGGSKFARDAARINSDALGTLAIHIHGAFGHSASLLKNLSSVYEKKDNK